MTSMPREAAAISEPRRAKKARPVLESRRLAAAKTTSAAVATATRKNVRRSLKSKWGSDPGSPMGRSPIWPWRMNHCWRNRNSLAIQANTRVATAR
jgi:hypothetical protein